MSDNPSNKASWLFLLLPAAAVLTLLYLYSDPLLAIWDICWTQDDYSHGILLPFIAGYLIWDNRKKLNPDHNPRISRFWITLSGVLLLSFGLLLLVVGSAANSLFAQWFSFFPSLSGTIILCTRGNIPRFCTPPCLLVFLSKPIPDSLVPKLFGPFQNLAAKISAYSLELLDVPVYLQGNIIEIPGMRLMVEEACSGMRSLMAILAVTFIVLFVVELSRLAQLFFVASAIFVAIVLNMFRVVLTGILAHFVDHKLATGFFHTFSGMLVFVVGLIILYFLGRLLENYSLKAKKVKFQPQGESADA